jgi:hypothetical protein
MYQLGGCPEKIARGAVFDLLRYSLSPLMRVNWGDERGQSDEDE